MTSKRDPCRWRVILSCLIAALCVPAASVMADAGIDAQQALRRGLVALDQGDARTARVELMNAVKAAPTLAAARVAQARALLMLGNGNAAQIELDRAKELGVPPSSIRHLLAHSALLRGEPEEALEQASADDVDPREAIFAARIAGQAQQALGRFDDAFDTFSTALKQAPGDPELWADMSRFHIASGDIAAAVVAANRAVTLAPRSPDALTLRAMLVREQYGLVAALPWFQKVVDITPDYVPALIEYAATLADAGQSRAALAMTRRALALAPGLPRAYFIQALMAARADRNDLARSLLNRTHGALDGQSATRLLRGVLHLQSGEATLAVGQLEPLLRAHPLNIDARVLLARAYYEAADFPSAWQTIAPIIERADADSYALLLAARVAEARGDRPAATDLLARASQPARGRSAVFAGAGPLADATADAAARPADAMANLRYIRALLEIGQARTALDRASALRASNPGAPAAYAVEGDCLMALGRPLDAARAYERSADLRFSESTALRLVNAWLAARRPAEAQRALGLFLSQNPMSIDGRRLAAKTWLAAGRYAEARTLLDGLERAIGSEDVVLMTDMAYAWIGDDQADKALPYAAHAYRLQPSSAIAADALGWSLHKSGRGSSDAVALLEKAQALSPDEPLVHFHLGMVYADAGRGADARRQLTLAAAVPGFAKRSEALAALKRL